MTLGEFRQMLDYLGEAATLAEASTTSRGWGGSPSICADISGR